MSRGGQSDEQRRTNENLELCYEKNHRLDVNVVQEDKRHGKNNSVLDVVSLTAQGIVNNV